MTPRRPVALSELEHPKLQLLEVDHVGGGRLLLRRLLILLLPLLLILLPLLRQASCEHVEGCLCCTIMCLLIGRRQGPGAPTSRRRCCRRAGRTPISWPVV